MPIPRRPCEPSFTSDTNEQTKLYICDVLKRGMARMQMNQFAISRYTGTSQSVISDIQNSKIERLSFNQLFHVLVHVAPFYKLAIDMHKCA